MTKRKTQSQMSFFITQSVTNKMSKFVVIGDPHFQVTNVPEVDLFMDRVTALVQEREPDFVVVLGDVLHTHERLHTTALNKAYELIHRLRRLRPTYVLVGNHDLINNQQFLTDKHWMNGLKEWENVTIVDTVQRLLHDGQLFVFCPYVPPGRFEEALDHGEMSRSTQDVEEEDMEDGKSSCDSTSSSEVENEELDDEKGFEGSLLAPGKLYKSPKAPLKKAPRRPWRDAACIFAHQEFYGCKMGAIKSHDGDRWPLSFPMVVSGHIHSRQRIQENVYYTGSALQHAFGESEKNIIAVMEFSDGSFTLDEVDLELPRKRIVYKGVEDMEDYEMPPNKGTGLQDTVKVTLSGSYDQFKAFKKTKKYKQLIAEGAKIVFKPKKIRAKIDAEGKVGLGEDGGEGGEGEETVTDARLSEDSNFRSILAKLVLYARDPYLFQIHERVLNGKTIEVGDVVFL